MRMPMPVSPRTDLRLDRDLVEIDAAIALVASRAARRVRLVNLRRPIEAADEGAARAAGASVEFCLDRSSSSVEIVVGPRR